MKNEKNLHQSYFESHPSALDNEKTLSYSLKDGSINNNGNFNGRLKSEYQHISQHYHTDNIEDQKSNDCFEINNTIKNEETMSSLTSCEIDAFSSKKRQLFKCSHCSKVFSNSSAIAKHKLTHSDERKYACDTCGKAFKRQDHLNGHKHTHKTNKPHACHLCDRSYSDARSLRRHYETQHQNEFLRCKEQKIGRDSGGSSVDECGSVDVFRILDEGKCIKCDVCGKAFKNQSALNGHMRLHGGYGQTKNCITGPGEPPPLLAATLTANSPEKSDVAPSSSRVSSMTLANTLPLDFMNSKLHSLLTMAPSAVDNTLQRDSLAHNDTVQGFDHCLSALSSSGLCTNNASNISMDELCMCLSPPPVPDHLQTTCSLINPSNPSSTNSHISPNTANIANDQHSSHRSHYSPINPAFVNQIDMSHLNNSRIFNYPTHIASHNLIFETANEEDQYQCSWNDPHTEYISTNSTVLPKQWSYFDTPDNKSSNPSSLPPISSSNNFQDIIMNLESIDPCSNLETEWCKFSDGNDDTNIVAESSETESLVKKDMMDRAIIDNPYSCPQSSANENTSDSLYQQSLIPEVSMPVSHKKSKSRPAPIFIPPQTSAHMSRLRSPRVWNTTDSKEVKIPPYTPPPMLSPQRKGSGLFNSVWQFNSRTSGNSSGTMYSRGTPLSTNIITAMSNSCCNDSLILSSSMGNHQISSAIAYSPVSNRMSRSWLDPCGNFSSVAPRNREPEHFLYHDECLECQPQTLDDSDGLPTSVTPRINIGPQYQAQLPAYRGDKRRPTDDKREWDVLLWNPKQFKDTVENTSSLDLLMKIASSPAVKSCGLNMEYTFHLLCKFKGDLEKTLQALLEDSFVVYDYVYAETTNWTTYEINKFQERLKKHDRDFMRVALDLQSYGMNKSVKACVEFYYVWKQMNNVKDINRYRLKSSRKKQANNTPVHDNDICSGVLSSEQATVDSGYNLRNKLPSGNQKLYRLHSSYDYRTSSDSSSREPSPSYCKPPKNMSVTHGDRVKKSRSYHCTQCKRKFTKSKTLEKHLRSHHDSNVMRDKLSSR